MQTTVNPLSLSQTYDLAALSSLHTLAHHCVARQRIAPKDQVDCVHALLVCLLQHDRLQVALDSHAFAAHCATNYGRNQTRITRHETAYPQHIDEDGALNDQEFVKQARTAPAVIIQQEASSITCKAMRGLTILQRDMVTRHFYGGESFVELADATGSTPDAVRMTINRACKRLRIILRQNGITEEDANEYLAEIDRGSGG